MPIPTVFAQVVTNLLSNAIKFSPPNGEVEVRSRQHDDGFASRYATMAPEFRPTSRRMFSTNSRRPTPRMREQGRHGLGLSIVKQIMTRLGGTVGFDDAPGGGTVFHLDLPSRDQVTARAIDPGGTPGAPRILLCADDPNKTMALRKGLHFAFVIDFAHIRADAIARAAATAYGAIVIDLELPAGDNIALIRDLSSRSCTMAGRRSSSCRRTPTAAAMSCRRSSAVSSRGWTSPSTSTALRKFSTGS